MKSFVFAGSCQEYRKFIRDHRASPNQVQFIHKHYDVTKLKGLRSPRIFLVGSYFLRKDYYEIMDELMVLRAELIEVRDDE